MANDRIVSAIVFMITALYRYQQMKKCNIDNAPIKKVKKDYFTGSVTLREISRITKPTEHDIYHVTFKKSARTKLHFHTGGQMLIVTKGNWQFSLL